MDTGKFNPKVNPHKKNNVLDFKIVLDGKHSDTIYKGRHIDIYYKNMKKEKYEGGFTFVGKNLRFYINFGIFPNKAYIIQDSPVPKAI